MMNFIWKYKTPEGFDDLVMCGDDEALTGLWFAGSRDGWRMAGMKRAFADFTPRFRLTLTAQYGIMLTND
jgi:methylated-DNA-[protein]-cysteine S-methyltransferase